MSWQEQCQHRYGNVFRIHYPLLGPVVVLADPEAVRAVYMDRDTAISRRPVQAFVQGPTLAFMDGAPHLRRRRLLLPPFHGESLRGYERIIEEVVARRVSAWSPGMQLRLKPVAQTLALDVITRALFGVSDPRAVQRFAARFSQLVPAGAMAVMLPRWTRSERIASPWRRFLSVRADVRGLVHEQIAEHRERASGERGATLCALLLSVRDEDGAPLSDEEICDELITLGIGGSHTTALSLSWVFDYLLHDPPTLARLEADPDDAQLCDAVVQETLRIRPVVDSGPRLLTRGMELAGAFVPAGEVVFPSFHLVHRNPDLYETPDEFIPERFVGKRPPTYGWLPFGGGSRRCIGAALAQLEMRVVVREVLKRWRVRPNTPGVSRPRRSTLFWVPAGGVPVTVTARR